MKDTFEVTLCKEEFELIMNHDVGRIIVTNEDNPDECLVYYVNNDEE